MNAESTRPSYAELIAAVGKLPTALLGDAMGRNNVMTAAIQPLSPHWRVAGTAYTVACAAGDNLALHVALHRAQPGAVLVVDTGEEVDYGFWGELMTLDAIQSGLAGLVIDGGVRDRSILAELDFPIWCRSINPRGTKKEQPGAVAVPVRCGGLLVNPGDVIVADADGVAVIPGPQLPTVLAQAEARSEQETAVRRRIAAGERLADILHLNT